MRLGILGLAGLIALSGCGGGGSADRASTGPSLGAIPTATTPLATAVVTDSAGKQSFIAKADAVCASYQAEGKRLRPPAQAADLPALGRYLDQLANVATKIERGLEQLTPPASERPFMRKYLDALKGQLVLMRQTSATALTGDAQSAQGDLAALSQADSSANARGLAYGFKVCASTKASTNG